MRALIKYRDSSEFAGLDDLSGTDREIIDRILQGYDVDHIWIVPDGTDLADFDYYGETPAWQLNTFWITRKDGRVAKIGVGDYGDGADFWTAIDQQYPEAYDLMEIDMVESEAVIEYSRWDARFEPGEGAGLAAWLKEGEQ